MKLGGKDFESLLGKTDAAIVVIDQPGVIRFINLPARQLFGYQGDELVGQPVDTLVPPPFRRVHQAHRAEFMAHPQTRFMGPTQELPGGQELSGRRRDGSQFPVDIVLGYIDTEDGPLVIATVNDITDRQNARAEMTRHQEWQ